MKKASTSPDQDTPARDMLQEYQFDYKKAKPNRFSKSAAVVLDPDVSKVFTTPAAVNTALRELITTMPKARKE
jgi:hypothetical protein